MRLILVRHAEARAKDEDPERHLTPDGEWQARTLAAKLSRREGPAPARICHSGKTRARETAEALAAALGVRDLMVEEEDLSPNADPSAWGPRLDALGEYVVLVGHLPHIARLAGFLIEGDPEAQPLEFGTATAVCLQRGGAGWRPVWTEEPGPRR